jgi:hypothetical protein
MLFKTVAVVGVSTFVVATAAGQSDQWIPREKHKHHRAANREMMQNPKFPGMNARIEPGFPGANAGLGRPSAEWDCAGGDVGCSWEPYGWRRN